MGTPSGQSQERRLARVGQWLCLGGATLGALGLLGWLTGTSLLTTIVPGRPAMMPNTAVALLLIGSAGAARHPHDIGRVRNTLSFLAALAVLAVGVGTLAEYALAIDLQIDRLLVSSETSLYAGRPSPLTALALTCLATAILLFDVRATGPVRPSEGLVLCAAVAAYTGLIGLVFGAAPLYRLARAPLIGLSLPTAVSLLLTSTGLLLERPTAGVMRVATAPGSGSMFLRRLALPAIIVPVLIGLVVTRLAPIQGIVEVPIALAILVSTMTVVGLFLLLVTAVPLNHAHERLEANRTNMRNLVEQASDAIFVADIDGRYTDVNNAGCRMLGYRREEIVGKTIIDLLHPEEVERLWQSRERLLGGTIHVDEWRLRRQDGSYVPVEVSAKVLPDGRWQAFVRDISERKRFEDERQVFVSLLENASDFIGIADPNGKPIYLNPAGRRMVGLPVDYPVENTQIAEYYPSDQRAYASDVIVRSMVEQGRWHGETYFRHWQTQEAIPVSDDHFMIRDSETGRVLGMGTITRDISDARRTAAEREQLLAREQLAHRQAETANEQLRESEEKYHALFDSIDEGFCVIEVLFDDTGNTLDYRFLEVNRAFEQQTGISNAVGRRVREIVPALEEHWFQIYGQIALTGESRRFENPALALGRFYDVYAFRLGRPEQRHVAVLFNDITKRKQSEEALHESEERFRLTIDEAPIGMALVALDGRFVRVNRALCEIVGYGSDELTGLTFQAITHPDDFDADLALAGQLARGEIPRYHLDKRYIRKDGTIVDIQLGCSILRSREGAPLYYIVQIEDITARKRLENELRLAEARATGILSISADAIICVDEQQHITLFNDGAETIFGYSKAEAMGAPVDILVPERLRAVHREHVTRFAASPSAARKAGTRDSVIVGLRKNGEEFPADAAISKLEVDGRQILTAVIRDVTEQKRIENEQRFLAEVGPLLATTLDYEETLSRIADITVQNLSDFCIVDLVDENGEVRRLRVVSRDPSQAWICDVIYRTPLDRSRPHLVRSALESREPILMQRPSPEDIDGFAQNDDHRRALRAIGLKSVMAVPLLARDKLLGVIVFLSATPFRIYGREDLRVANELAQRAALAVDNARLYRSVQRAVQVRDEVLGIVAHDLRNPLSTVLMSASLLRRYAPEPERRFKDRLDVIVRSATRMNRLIQDLLDVTRMEAGRLTIEPSRVPAAQIASEGVEAQKPLASSASLELRLDRPEELPDLWADRDRLQQVFENLIGNAIKFTPSGGCITVGAAPRGADVVFRVADTGPGITVEDQLHLFDRFWQARTAGRSGAGLGLPIVKGIVEAHGGRIWVESAPGLGSTFFFTIPAAQPIERTTGDRGVAHHVRDVA